MPTMVDGLRISREAIGRLGCVDSLREGRPGPRGLPDEGGLSVAMLLAACMFLGGGLAFAQEAEQDDSLRARGLQKEEQARSTVLRPAGLPESAWEPIEDLNVRGADLRDLLRAIAEAHELNLVIRGSIDERVTTRLTGVPAARAIAFLADEHGLKLEQKGTILRVSRPKPEKKVPNITVSEGARLSVDLAEVPLREVARQLSKQASANVVVGQEASGTISGYLDEAAFEAGLESLMQENGFRVTRTEDIYTIRPAENGGADGRRGLARSDIAVRGGRIDITARDAPVKQLLADLAEHLELEMITYQAPEGRITASVSGLGLEEALGYLLRGSGVTFRRAQGRVYVIGSSEAGGMASSRLVRLNHLKAESIIALMPQALQSRTAINVVTEQNGLVVTGPQEAIAEVEAFIMQVDRPTPQIMIEALVVDYKTDDLYELGVRFGKTAAEGPDGAPAPRSPRSTYSFDADGYELDANGPRVGQYLETLGEVLGGLPGISNIGTLPPEFYLQVQALAQEGIAEVRSRPKITTLNGHEASLSIGTTQYYILRSSGGLPLPSAGERGGYPVGYESERFEKVEANVSLNIIPWVTASGEVTVEIAPEFSTPVGALTPEVPPTINTRTVNSTVRLEDGETIILGGLIQDAKRVRYNEVPVLGQIPLLGQLFRSRRHDLQESELVIYLTPHVFYGGEEERRQWEEMPDRLGLRDPEAGTAIGYTQLKKRLEGTDARNREESPQERE